ncbi:MAG: sugar transferase [Acidobacteria bacterium]|nr:sugar transferase [Acidobacteriota bacterium]
MIGLLMTETLLAYGCYILAFRALSDDLLDMYLLYEGGLERIGVAVGSILLGIYFNDLYSELRVYSRLRLVQQFCLVIGMAFLAQALLSYVSRDLIISRWQMILGSGLALVLLPAWRLLWDRLVIRVMNRQRVLFVGSSGVVRAVAETLVEKPQFAMVSVGYLNKQELDEPVEGMGGWLGPVDSLREVYNRLKPDLIAVGFSERRGQVPSAELLELKLAGARVQDAASLYEMVMWRVPVETLRSSEFLLLGDLGPSRRSLALQKMLSYLIAVTGAAITLPLMLLVWMAVRLSSPGPALYRQKRVGLQGKVFEVFKFRSMYIDAEARTGAVWARKDDPRVTRLGYWLRKLRLDELPQFFNVLRGDMAIVGPRPERPEFVKVLSEQIPFYGQRHAILPGITGWAQINHKYGDSIEDTITKLEFDLYYLKHMSLSLDMYIIFHTLKVMLLSRGSQ